MIIHLIRDLNKHLKSVPIALKLVIYFVLLGPGILLAHNLKKFDTLVKSAGLAKAAEWLLKKYGVKKELIGSPIPASGPVLVVCNHPGVFDGTALCSELPRNDVKIVADGTAFFVALPNLASHLILVQPGDPKMRAITMLKALRVLKGGEMLLLFGRGIDDEPDPKFTDAARDVLRAWPAAVGTLVLGAQEEGFRFTILPVLISNVFSKRAERNPLLSKIPEGNTRELVDRLYVLLRGGEDGQTLKLKVGNLLDSVELAKISEDPAKLSEVVRDRLRELRDSA